MSHEMLERIWKRGKDFLGVRTPIICGGMTWVSDFALVQAVAEHGAFPVLAGGNMPPEAFEELIDRCLREISTPFAVNLITIAPHYQAHREIVQGTKVPVVIFAGSFPRKAEVQAMKAGGKKVICFASTDSMAEQQIRFGADALILEGSEAGGHIGHVSLTILLQQVLFRFNQLPVFTAGGIATGRMMAHLLLMGSAGVQLGTRFVLTEECSAHPAFKQALIRARAREAVATPQYDSRLPVVAVRAIHNRGMAAFGRLQLNLLKKLEAGEISREDAQFEVERFWIGGLRRAVQDGDVSEGSLMAGQSVGLADRILPMRELLRELVDDAAAELTRVRSVLE